jgi:hypothetical protein
MCNDNIFENIDIVYTNLNESNELHGVNFLTLVILLFEKGIIDDDDFNRAQAQARHIVEQEFAKKRDAQGGDS